MTIPDDKRQHAAMSGLLMAVFAAVALWCDLPLLAAAGAALVPGAAREAAQYLTAHYPLLYAWADEWRLTRWAMIGDAEWGDMLGNTVGVTLVYLALWSGILLLTVWFM